MAVEKRDPNLALYKRNRKTVGLLIDWIGTPYHLGILSGLSDYLEKKDINFLCFVTGRLNSELESEKCRNIFFDFVSGYSMDGLVITAASIANLSGKDALWEVIKNYTYLPIVTMGETFENITSISVDNEKGVRKLLTHLVEEHHYQRFTFVRGQQGNHDAEVRFEAFKKILAEYKIPLVPELVLEGDFRIDSGKKAAQTLLSREDLNIDAIVCSNDVMAHGMIEVFKSESGSRLADIPVTGFDDIEISKYNQLTTVRQAFYKQGRLAGETIETLMNGMTADLLIFGEPELVIRESCGCQTAGQKDQSKRGKLHHTDNLSHEEIISQKILVDYHLEEFSDISERLIGNLEMEDQLGIVCREFPHYGIHQCFISLYDDPAEPLALSRLILAYDGEKSLPIDKKGIQFPTTALVPPGILPSKNRHSLIVEALFQGFEHIGFVMFGLGNARFRTYEVLRHALSIAFKGIKLVEKLKQYTENLEEQVVARTKELSFANTQLEQEIVERRYVEQKLKESEEHFRELALLLPTIIFELDLRLRFTFINNAGYEALGLPEEEPMPSQSFMDYIHEDDEDIVREFCSKILKQRVTQYCEFRINAKDDKSVTLISKANPIFANGVIKGIRMSGINIKPFLSTVIMPEDLFFEHYHFSPRVKEVLILMLQGYKTKDIAKKLFIAESTVKAHIRAIYTDVGVDNRTDFFKVLEEYQVNQLGYHSYIYSILTKLIKE